MSKINSFAYVKTISLLICNFVYQQLFMTALKKYRLAFILAICLLGLGVMTVTGPLKSWQEKVYVQNMDYNEEGNQTPESGTEWEEETVYDHPGMPPGLFNLHFLKPVNGFLSPAPRLVYLSTHTPPPDPIG